MTKTQKLDILYKLEDDAIEKAIVTEADFRAARSLSQDASKLTEADWKKIQNNRDVFKLRLAAIRELIKEIQDGTYQP